MCVCCDVGVCIVDVLYYIIFVVVNFVIGCDNGDVCDVFWCFCEYFGCWCFVDEWCVCGVNEVGCE